MCNIRNRAVLAAGFASLLLFSGAALAAGAYDGTWTGRATTGGCAGTVVTVTVADNSASASFTGTVTWTFRSRPINEDGVVSWINARAGRFSKLTFTGNSFEMVSNTFCGHLSVTGSRQ